MINRFDNKYEFVKDLGKGGFGIVFLAKEEVSNRLVAIKQLNNQDKAEQNKIVHEIQVVAQFNHPNVVTYLHHFFQDELLFLVMEYCAGGSLRGAIINKKINSVDILRWMTELSATFQVVHEKGIIHHDIKPDNILFTESKTIKVSDFGIANTGAGTPPYMSPEALSWESGAVKDERVDVYALGVTLLELLAKRNPFFGKSPDEILELHDKKDFGITGLPHWQQEVILKAIAKIPEQRFQSMKDFKEAIQAQSVPITFNKEAILAGDLAKRTDTLLKKKKWQRAFSILEYAERELKPNVNILEQKGKYLLLRQEIDLAKACFDKALKLNPRLDVQKELGWINLELKNYPTAISLLSDHLHRNPSDYEAFNLLLQCYYETNRYEPAMDLARTLLEVEPTNKCFANNYYICCAMKNIGQAIFPNTVLKGDKDNPFLDYNYSVILETEPSHGFAKNPTLKSKLLFMDYRFNKLNKSTLYCTDTNIDGIKTGETQKPIIKFGRESFEVNDVKVPGALPSAAGIA